MRNSVLFKGMICASAFWVALSIRAEDSAQVPNLLVRVHFGGSAKLDQEPNAAKFKALWNLPATKNLREQVLQKLARAPHELYHQRLVGPQVDRSMLFRPLWEDLLASESDVELCGQNGQALEWTVAVRLTDKKASLWSTNLWQAFSAWNGGQSAASPWESGMGWEMKNHQVSPAFRFARAGAWCVIGFGGNNLQNHARVVAEIKKNGTPGSLADEAWLELYGDLPRLTQWWRPAWLDLYPAKQLPIIDLSFSSWKETVRTKGSLHFRQPVAWQMEAWQFPTNSIRDPLVSFTAVQGLRPCWADFEWARALNFTPAPNQLYVWSQAQAPFLLYWAAPMKRTASLLERWATSLPAYVKSKMGPLQVGKIIYENNETSLVWTDLPVLRFFLRPATEPNGEFLLGGLYPSLPLTNPPPQELIAQVASRTNLLYYNWEITQNGLTHDRIVLPLLHMIFSPTRIKLDCGMDRTNSLINPWLAAVGPLLGNAITEITAKSPKELALIRNSHIGLTSFELVLLVHWLDDPCFPLFGYTLPALVQPPADSATRKQ